MQFLPDQRLQRQIDADGLRCLHQWRAAFGVAEDQKIGRPQRQADLARAWQQILGRVTSYADCEPALLGRVEELIDFVTAA